MTTTTSSTAHTITKTLGRTQGLAEALLKGISEDQFARFPVHDGKTINTNHASFVYGHLSLYPKKILDIIGKDSSSIEYPPKFAELYMHGVECKDDPKGDIYPAMDEVLAYFRKAHETVISIVSELDEETLTKELTGEDWYVGFAQTPAALITFMLHSHYMFHLGQLSAWRRCMGLGPAEM